MRVSDSDRETVAAICRRHHLEGRLDLEELFQRLDRCHTAKTVGELLPVFVMLVGISLVAGAHVFWLAIPLTVFAFRGFGWSGGWLAGAVRRRALPSVSLADHHRHPSGTWSR
ncbi:MAG: DUF1707 SHOCT-like domain-containing protein [Solirubrobacteraceae bacterium]